jgi:ribonuclease VapC
VSEVILDASALLAFLRKEPGGKRVAAILGQSMISAVNLTEVFSKAIDHGGTVVGISNSLLQLPVRVVPFGPEDAVIAGSLRAAIHTC